MKKHDIKKYVEYINSGYTYTKIAKLYNVSLSTIRYQLKKHGYFYENRQHLGLNRKCQIDANFFKSIDSKEKTYILGLVVSDGYVDENWNKLNFTSKDIELVKIFKRELKSGHKLATYNVFDKRTNKHYKRYSLQISSKEIVNDLNKMDINRNKSFNCSLPIIPDKLMWHFIRGVFDGDGTIYQNKKIKTGRLRFGIVGSEKLLCDINKFFKRNEIFNVYSRETKYGDSTGKLIRLDCSKFSDLKLLKDKMYEDSTGLRLTRKYEQFQTLKSFQLSV